MNNNDTLLSALKNDYDYNFNQIRIESSKYSLFSFGKAGNKNFLIVKNEVCAADEICSVESFIDGLSPKISNVSFVFIAFVNEDFSDDDYFKFNGSSFLHTVSYNLISSECIYYKSFYYFGSSKIKRLLKEIKQCLERNHPVKSI